MKHDFTNHISIPPRVMGLIRVITPGGATSEFLASCRECDTTCPTTIMASASIIVGIDGEKKEERDVFFWN